MHVLLKNSYIMRRILIWEDQAAVAAASVAAVMVAAVITEQDLAVVAVLAATEEAAVAALAGHAAVAVLAGHAAVDLEGRDLMVRGLAVRVCHLHPHREEDIMDMAIAQLSSIITVVEVAEAAVAPAMYLSA